jgi:hypothetical protein
LMDLARTKLPALHDLAFPVVAALHSSRLGDLRHTLH